MSDNRLSGYTMTVHRTADPVWLEIRGDGHHITRINIVRAIWINEPEPRNPDPQQLSLTDEQVNGFISPKRNSMPRRGECTRPQGCSPFKCEPRLINSFIAAFAMYLNELARLADSPLVSCYGCTRVRIHRYNPPFTGLLRKPNASRYSMRR